MNGFTVGLTMRNHVTRSPLFSVAHILRAFEIIGETDVDQSSDERDAMLAGAALMVTTIFIMESDNLPEHECKHCHAAGMLYAMTWHQISEDLVAALVFCSACQSLSSAGFHIVDSTTDEIEPIDWDQVLEDMHKRAELEAWHMPPLDEDEDGDEDFPF